MAKMKVHELSKELDVPSKDILAFLNDNGIEVKAAQSSIEDDAIALVKKKFSAAVKASGESEKTNKNEAPAGKPSVEANKASGQEALPVKKKKSIIVVSNPHNSTINGGRTQSGSQGTNRPTTNNGNNGANRMQNGSFNKNANSGNVNRHQNNQNRTISGNTYARPQLIKPREEAINRVIPDKFSAHDEEIVKEENTVATPVVEVSEPVNASTPVEPVKPVNDMENEKREFVKKDTNFEKKDINSGSDRRDNRDSKNFRDNRNSQGNNSGERGFRRNDDRNGNRNENRNENRFDNNRGERSGFSDRKPYQNRNSEKGDFQGRENNRRDGGRNQGGMSGQGRSAYSGQSSFAAEPVTSKPGSDRRDEKFKEKNKNNKNFDNKDNEKKTNDKRRNQERESRNNRNFLLEDDEETLAMKRRTGKFIKPEKKVEVEEVIKVISIDDSITIKDLAEKMKIQPAAIVKKLFMQGKIVTVNQEISFEEAENIAVEYDIICEKAVKVDVIEELLKEEEDDAETLVSRPPVICVMGHVDHGKTSLLDAIRKTKVIDKEAGGITQAIGAYTVDIKGRQITFLDTPGHEAFTAMRMRGANSTDIAVLVVAADDGVMPQTIEAINHAKAAGVEIIVAVNKIDKPAANPDKVKQELTEYELIPTEWGGSTEFVNISAKKGDGIDDLLETILLTADIMELKANPKRKARGLVIEAELDKGRGPVATILVQKGTLKVGDFISAGVAHGKVRAMLDDKGKNVKVAGPSIPVMILGLNDVPEAGDVFIAHDNDKTAKSFADTYIAKNKEQKLDEIKARMSLDDLFEKIQEGNLKELNLIIKGDVQGSVEAIKQSLIKLSNEEVVVKCIHGGVGAINESDVSLASASNAIIIGFNVRPDPIAKQTAEHEGVDVRLYSVIYNAIEDIEAAMKGMLDPVFEEKIIGHAEVRQIFKASAIGNIAGSYVLDGVFQRGCKIRITREGKEIYDGALSSLKRFKDDVKEVKAGFECGLVFEDFDRMQELDQVEAYMMVEVPR